MPLNTVENNRAISLQSVKFMSVVWERNSQGELCQKQCHLWAYPRLCSLRGNIRGFIPLGGREEEREGRRAMGKGKQEMRDLSRLFS